MSCCSKPKLPQVKACFGNAGKRNLLAPNPDEVIMTALDRILYHSGATKIFHQFNFDDLKANDCPPPAPCSAPCTPRATSSCSSINSVMSNTSFSRYVSAKSRNTCRPSSCRPSSCRASSLCTPLPTPPRSFSCKSKCSTIRPTRPRTPHVDFANPVIDDRQRAGGPTFADRMKYSISTASLAYSRLKSKLSSGQKWLWTRLVRTEDGCHVYEVYKNSDVGRAPHRMKGGKEAVILFVVTPKGHVMPFETVSSY